MKLAGEDDHGGIQVFVPGTSLVAMTDPAGEFSLAGVPAGSHVVRAQYPGFRPLDIATVVVPDDRAKRYVLETVELEPRAGGDAASAGPAVALGSIAGDVRFTEADFRAGLPFLGGGRAELAGTPMRTITEDDGSFLLWNVETGYYTLRVAYPGYEPWEGEVGVYEHGATARVTIESTELLPGGDGTEIAGEIELLTPEGEPIFDYLLVTVGIRELPGRALRVDPDGRFRARNIPAGSYTLYAEAQGFEPSGNVTIDLTEGDRVETTLTLIRLPPPPEPPGAVAGSATLEGRADSAGATAGLAGTSHVAVTSADGRFLLSEVPPGEYELVVQADGFAPVRLAGIEVRSGETTTIPPVSLEPILEYPVVLATEPAEGTRDFAVRPEMLLTVRFSKKMDVDSLRRAVSLEPAADYAVFAGKEHPKSDFDLLVVEIRGPSREAPVRYDELYRLRISVEAKDVEGLALREPFVLSFRTGKAAVIASAPAQGEKSASIHPGRPLVFRFNAPVNPESIDARDIRIRPSIGGTPAIQTFTDPETGWSALHIQGTWSPGTSYEVTLPRRIRTASGDSISNLPYRLKFQTAAGAEFPGFTGRIR